MPVGPFGKEESLFAEREWMAVTEVATLGKQKGRHAIAVPFFVSARGQAVSGPDPAARHPSPSLLPRSARFAYQRLQIRQKKGDKPTLDELHRCPSLVSFSRAATAVVVEGNSCE